MKFRRRDTMFRKHFRFKRLALGLAFAGLIVPVTPATAGQPSYLRYHEVGAPVAAGPDIRSEAGPEIRSENALNRSTLTPVQADGLRWTAMAQRYEQLQPTVAISERSNGVKGPDPSLVPQLAVSTSNGFDWTDAGVGASTMFGVALLLGVAILYTRRNQHSGLTQA
jgi:hypothetical protein